MDLAFSSLKELEINFEEAQFLRNVATWGLEAEACGVDEGHDREGHASVGQVGAASAAIVLKLDFEEVLIRDVARMGRWLDTSDHKRVFGRQLHLDTSFFLELFNLVSDDVQVD